MGQGSILIYILVGQVWSNSMVNISMYKLFIHLKGGGAYFSSVMWCWDKVHLPYNPRYD